MTNNYSNRKYGERGRSWSNKQSHNSKNNSSKGQNNERELKFNPNTHGKQNSATFATVKEAIILNIQRYFKFGYEVAKSIEDEAVIDIKAEKPTRDISTDANVEARTIEQDGFNIDYQEALRRYYEKADAIKEGLMKTYSLIYGSYCTKTMQVRIQAHPDFDKFKNDPIELMKAIKTLVHDPVRAQYPPGSMTAVLTKFLVLKQYDNESLLGYIKRSKQQRDFMKSYLGKSILDEFKKNK